MRVVVELGVCSTSKKSLVQSQYAPLTKGLTRGIARSGLHGACSYSVQSIFWFFG